MSNKYERVIKKDKTIVADIKDTSVITPNELAYFQCPLIYNHLEGFITIRFKTGGSIQFPFQLVFHSLDKRPPADIGLFLPEGYTITPKLNMKLFNNIMEIFLDLKREKESGVTFEEKMRELAEYHSEIINKLMNGGLYS